MSAAADRAAIKAIQEIHRRWMDDGDYMSVEAMVDISAVMSRAGFTS